jgi:polyphosphate kinase
MSKAFPRTERYLNRELSWLEFNVRVLAIAEDRAQPVLERVKFLSIYGINLDEFFQVRVAGLQEQREAGVVTAAPDGMTPEEQLRAIAARVHELSARVDSLWLDDLQVELDKEGIRIVGWDAIDERDRAHLTSMFREHIFPVLTPLSVDPAHPFPYISSLSLNLAAIVRDPASGDRRFARVKVPPLLPRFLEADAPGTFVPLEDVIAANLGLLFPGMTILEHHPFRVTRTNDLEIDDDEAEDLLRALEAEIRRRRFSPAVRLEVERRMPEELVTLLMRELQLTERDVHRLPGPLGLADLFELASLDRSDLNEPPFAGATPPEVAIGDNGTPDLFRTLRAGDLLVHHPYDSFATTVQDFIEQAAADPQVLAIKQTLYRTSGESPIVDALVAAAESGKQVVVLVEIKARFDEQANIAWARTLERAGCHVVYGLIGLKTHCKLCLVVRQEEGRLRRYVHVGTGNYNPSTARLYEDIGLLTADAFLGADVSHLFNLLTGYSRRAEYGSIIVAPADLRRRVIGLIGEQQARAERGQPARIVMKLNNLVDEAVIDALYGASGAGVPIDLVIRSICALRPGVRGLSDTIRVRSILGRFLEHSRIYQFGVEPEDEIWIGSADLMHRNLDRRVEVLVRVGADGPRSRLQGILDLALADTDGAWELDPDGTWRPHPPTRARVSLQETLMQRAGQAANVLRLAPPAE